MATSISAVFVSRAPNIMSANWRRLPLITLSSSSSSSSVTTVSLGRLSPRHQSYHRPFGSSRVSMMMKMMMNRGGAPATPTATATHDRMTLLRPSIIISSRGSRRSSSSSSGPRKETASSSTGTTDSNESTSSHEIVLTPGEKVVATTRLFFYAGALTFASMCAYYIGKELLPTKMSPNTVFDKATAIVRQNTEVTRRFGESIKTYGRDHGGHREGRRNFIEHTEYTDPDDGSQRTRVRFNLEGNAYNGGAQAFVFAEVSNNMPSGEFVYILVQDKRNGAVITVQDNRSALLAKRLAGGSQEGQDVFSRLLGGGGGAPGKQ